MTTKTTRKSNVARSKTQSGLTAPFKASKAQLAVVLGLILVLGGFVIWRVFAGSLIATEVETWPATGGNVKVVTGAAASDASGGSYIEFLAPAQTTISPTPVATLLFENFNNYSNGLITGEYTHWNLGAVDAKPSTLWDMTSGSLFAQNQTAWTGVPDDCSGGSVDPNATSSNCNNSSIFRLNTKQSYSGNIQIDLSLRQNTDIHDANCNANDTCWHGTHIWARYQSQYNLYYASVNRADGNVVLKRKVPCGSDNSGTYFVLGNYVPNNWSVGQWNRYSLTVVDNADGSVGLKLYDLNKSGTTPLVTGTDAGGTNPSWSSGCSTPGKYSTAAYTPLRSSGQVGVRGDYANFNFDDFTVSQL